jgi:cyclopropane-fatty-acyl-phospholipid synthase
MGRHFFTGGMMPSVDLALRFQEHLVFETMHQVSGRHYARTARAWLANLDRERAAVSAALGEDGASPDEVRRRVNRWRLFFLAVEDLFAWRGGNEWFVTHQRFRRR